MSLAADAVFCFLYEKNTTGRFFSTVGFSLARSRHTRPGGEIYRIAFIYSLFIGLLHPMRCLIG
jgi:hypothetical protein